MKKILMLVSLFFSMATFAITKPGPLPTASNVDVARYMGKWYTITSLPQFYTRNCQWQTADYEAIDDKTINIKNSCYKSSGKTKIVAGKGEIQDAPNNAHLQIRLNTFWTSLLRRKGEYVIIKLSDDYETVMVGSNDRKSLWIMSREPTIDPTAFIEYKKLAYNLGFSVEQLKNSKY